MLDMLVQVLNHRMSLMMVSGHIIIPSDKLDLVESCEISVDDCLNVSRHRPVVCQHIIPQSQQRQVPPAYEQSINWKKRTQIKLI